MVQSVLFCKDKPGYAVECNNHRTIDTIHGLVDGYYKSINKPVIFNTNRLWTGSLNLLEELYPDTKVICCVRDINSILNSFEILYKKSPLAFSSIYKNYERDNIYTRSQALMLNDRVVGHSLLNFKEGLYSNQSKNMYLIEYQHLAQHPEVVMNSLYDFLQLPRFTHDFDNVTFSKDEYDTEIGAPGLHTIRKKVSYIEDPMLLPPDLTKIYLNLEVWRTTR